MTEGQLKALLPQQIVGVVALAALAACKPAPPPAPPTDTQVNGDIFIVTQGRQNIKLAPVEVAFIPETRVRSYLEQRLALAREAIEKTRPEGARLEAEVNEVEKTEERIKAVLDKERRRGRSGAWAQRMMAALHAHIAALNVSKERNEALREHKRQVNKFREGAFYFAEGFPPEVATAKSDADGRFAVALKPGGYAVRAISKRRVAADTEDYFWLVALKAEVEPSKRIMLSNDNLFETSCAECIVDVRRMALRPVLVTGTATR
jgi:hypothetical protein